MNARPQQDRVTGDDRTDGAFDVIIVGWRIRQMAKTLPVGKRLKDHPFYYNL
jgi:hypothetical protein